MCHDEDKDGKISLKEFENMLLGCNIKQKDGDSSMLFIKQ